MKSSKGLRYIKKKKKEKKKGKETSRLFLLKQSKEHIRQSYVIGLLSLKAWTNFSNLLTANIDSM